jgi:ABC-type lipoprotein release transport system permease subunit
VVELCLSAANDRETLQTNQIKVIEGDSVPGDRQLLVGYDRLNDSGFRMGDLIHWLVVVLVLSALVSILPVRNAARLTIREVLAYEQCCVEL